MRRELKVLDVKALPERRPGFSSCPDEEGTESDTMTFVGEWNGNVSAVVPMRRELKESLQVVGDSPDQEFQQLSR